MHYRNFWILLIMLLAGIVLGGFMGQMAEGIPWLGWLNFGQSFGLDSPLVVNFGILVITFTKRRPRRGKSDMRVCAAGPRHLSVSAHFMPFFSES